MKGGSRAGEEVGNRHRGMDSGHSHPTQSLPCLGVEGLEITGPEVLYLGAIRPSGGKVGKLSEFISQNPKVTGIPPRAKAMVLQTPSSVS